MARKMLVGAMLSTLILGVMTAGVRAGDGEGPARTTSEASAIADRAEAFDTNGLRGTSGCQTLKCINRTFRRIFRVLTGICVVPVTVYGNQGNNTSSPGYLWDNTTPPDGNWDFTTSAIDVTDTGQTPGALMLIDCP